MQKGHAWDTQRDGEKEAGGEGNEPLPFKGTVVGFELGMMKSNQKNELVSIVKKYGGQAIFLVNEKIHLMVTTPEFVQQQSTKVKTAQKYGIPIVRTEYLYECLKAKARVDEWPWLYINGKPATSLDKTGKKFLANKIVPGYDRCLSLFVYMKSPSRGSPSIMDSLAQTSRIMSGVCVGLNPKIDVRKVRNPIAIVREYFKDIEDKRRDEASKLKSLDDIRREREELIAKQSALKETERKVEEEKYWQSKNERMQKAKQQLLEKEEAKRQYQESTLRTNIEKKKQIKESKQVAHQKLMETQQSAKKKSS